MFPSLYSCPDIEELPPLRMKSRSYLMLPEVGQHDFFFYYINFKWATDGTRAAVNSSVCLCSFGQYENFYHVQTPVDFGASISTSSAKQKQKERP